MAAHRTLTARDFRVGHVLTGDAWAGAEVQAWEVVRRLAPHGFAPYVAVLNTGETFERFSALPLPVTLVDERRLGRCKAAAGVHAWIAESNLALVHVHKAKEELIVAFGGARSSRPPIVRTIHGAPELPRGWKRWKGALARELDFFALRHRTAAVIAVSEELAAGLRPLVGKTPLRVIRNGVTLPPSCCAPPSAHAPRLAYCGRLAPVKTLDLLIRAMPVVRRGVPDAELWLVGNGAEEPRLRALAAGLDLTQAVQFLGFRADVQSVFHEVDVVVLSSRHEGLPMVVLEAGAAGKPVVAPRIGGIPEVVRDGETGVLLADCTPETIAAACVALLRDPARARALGAAARRRVAAEFSADATAVATAAQYADVLGRGRAPNSEN